MKNISSGAYFRNFTVCFADVYDPSAPHVRIRTYVIVHDKSNHSLARAQLLDKLNIKGLATLYTLETCLGVKQTLGRRAHGLIIGALRSNDADGNENVKKTKGLISKTTTLHVHDAFFVYFFPVFARRRGENA